jgi:hypothetical protein
VKAISRIRHPIYKDGAEVTTHEEEVLKWTQ